MKSGTHVHGLWWLSSSLRPVLRSKAACHVSDSRTANTMDVLTDVVKDVPLDPPHVFPEFVGRKEDVVDVTVTPVVKKDTDPPVVQPNTTPTPVSKLPVALGRSTRTVRAVVVSEASFGEEDFIALAQIVLRASTCMQERQRVSTAAQASTPGQKQRPCVSTVTHSSTPRQKQRPCVSTVAQASTRLQERQRVSTAAQASTPRCTGQNQRPCVSTVAQERTSTSQGPLHVSNVVGTPVLFRAALRYPVAPP